MLFIAIVFKNAMFKKCVRLFSFLVTSMSYCKWILWIYLTMLLSLYLYYYAVFLWIFKIIFPKFPENHISIHSENTYYMISRSVSYCTRQ